MYAVRWFLTFLVFLAFQTTSYSVGIPIRLEAATVCSISVPLSGLTLEESARLFQARLTEWYKTEPRVPLHVTQFGDSSFIMANDHILWAFGPSEGVASGYDPYVLALRTELRIREIVLNRETVQQTRDPLSKLMLALIVIPLALVISIALWIHFMRYLRASIYKSQSESSATTLSHFQKKSLDIGITVITNIGIAVIVLSAILGWMYLFSTTRNLLNFFFPILGNLLSFAGAFAKWFLRFAVVFGGIYLLLRFLKLKLATEYNQKILEKRFSKLNRLGFILAIFLSLPAGIGLPEPIGWALPIATFLVIAFGAIPIVRALIVSVIFPLDPANHEIMIHWKDKNWKLDQLHWVSAHIVNNEGEEATIPLHWFLNDSETLYIVSRKSSLNDEQSSKSQ